MGCSRGSRLSFRKSICPPSPLSGLGCLLEQDDRLFLVGDDLLRDENLLDVRLRRDVVHHVEHDVLHDGAQPARAGFALERLARDGREGAVGEAEVHALHLEELLVLPGEGVLRLLQDADQRGLVELLEGGDDREPPHELGDQPELEEILRLDPNCAAEVEGTRYCALLQLGDIPRADTVLENFGRVAKIWVDPRTNEAYIADGYLNKRVAVIDADTGRMKRYWGAYGNKPDDTKLGNYDPKAPPAQQFRNPVHCVERSKDGLVYVCDRTNDRVQVFRPDGTFVKEAFFAKNTLGSGSAWDIAFSRDPEQRFIFLADGQNNRVRIIVRDTLEEVTAFGDGGRQPGQFYGVHSIATDSKGNIYTTETWEGKRVQKFVYKGIGNVMAANQGVLWPKR